MNGPLWGVKLCAWSHAKCLSLLALGFTHQEGLSYQIFELEDLALPQRGILLISAFQPKQQQQWPQKFGEKRLSPLCTLADMEVMKNAVVKKYAQKFLC